MFRCFIPRFVLVTLIVAVSQLNASPEQYYAQLYTEILGRAPTPEEWVANEYRFTQDGLSLSNVRSFAVSLFQSSEFNNLNYSSTDEAYVIYRSILLREPGSSELSSLATQVSRSNAADVASDMMNSTEFSNLLQNKISPAAAHAFLNVGPAARSTIGAQGLGNVSGAELQETLNAAASGDVVFLSKGSLIRIHEPLTIPAGVTLATHDLGASDNIYRLRYGYAAMGRLVRAKMFAKPLVTLKPGAKMYGVWVDGRRSQLRVNDPTLKMIELSRAERFFDSHNILVLGSAEVGQTSEVSHCKISDSTGWTSMHLVGANGGQDFGISRAQNNMITCYSASRDLEESFFTDGISNASSDATILGNDIVDPSDVGVVVFNPGMTHGQRSQVVNNNILFAGVEGWGGITMDHSVTIRDFCQGVNESNPYDCFDIGNPAIISNFSDVNIEDNRIWSSDTKYVSVGISMGVHLWGLRMFGEGGQVHQNQLGTSRQPLNTGVGIVVSGIKEPVVLENDLNLNLDQNLISCFSTDLLFDPTATTLTEGSAVLQEGFVSGETWEMLRARSNGYINGEYNLIAANQDGKGVAVSGSSLQVMDINDSQMTDDWVVLHSVKQFGDGKQYYMIMNQGNRQVIEADGSASVKIAPFYGSASQYWSFEAFEGNTVGRGVRLVNRVTGEYLGRDASGQVLTSSQSAVNSFSWKFKNLESRTLDFSQPDLLFMNPMGGVHQIYTDSNRIFENRSLGNPGVDLGLNIYADATSDCLPAGTLDFNSDGRTDTAFVSADGSLQIVFGTVDGLSEGGNLGSMRFGSTFGWDISGKLNSWEKPVGFMDMGGSSTEDLVVIDGDGFVEVGILTAEGVSSSRELGNLSAVGLENASSAVDAAVKPVTTGDFDGDGQREILFVDTVGTLYTVGQRNGELDTVRNIGNPLVEWGFGFTSAVDSSFKPVAVTDVTEDGTDDIVMVDGSGALVVVSMENGTTQNLFALGNPKASWEWNLSADSYYSRPLSIPFGRGWWNW